ncbi:unnamed protein product [Paramecium sonneborni]|uniref:Transmembrane protein n=1 Tax=Paramecium sonneborni TaxID=65129 RepID=A0A8S1PR22_9CILI|nr:unnamed protein product [Paramecium sonneborni]
MLLFLISSIFAQVIVEINDRNAHFYIHKGVRSTIIQLPHAWDGQLNGKGCELRQRSISENISYYKILEFSENNIEELTLVSQDDNRIVIFSTRSRLVIIHKNNLKEKISKDLSKYEMNYIHQIILNDNILLVITETIAYIIYLLPLGVPVSVIEFTDWIPRQERWLTNIYGDFIYTAVGQDGIDIYHLKNLTYYRSINHADIGYTQLCVKDFTIFQTTLYILDCSVGLIIAKMNIHENVIDFKVRKIDVQEGGIAVDTKNGINIFVGYKWKLRYAIVEYVVDDTEWRIQNLIYTNKIKDVDVNNEYAIIQGNSRHMVAFNFGTSLSNNIIKYNLRDFELRNNELIGITMTQLFRSHLQLIPLKVDCQLQQGSSHQFSLVYNVSHNGTTIERHHLKFQVNLVSTYLYRNQSYLVIILITLLLFIFSLIIIMIIKWYYNLRKEEKKIAKSIRGYSLSLPTSGRTNTQQSSRPFSPTNQQLIINNIQQQQ